MALRHAPPPRTGTHRAPKGRDPCPKSKEIPRRSAGPAHAARHRVPVRQDPKARRARSVLRLGDARRELLRRACVGYERTNAGEPRRSQSRRSAGVLVAWAASVAARPGHACPLGARTTTSLRSPCAGCPSMFSRHASDGKQSVPPLGEERQSLHAATGTGALGVPCEQRALREQLDRKLHGS